MLNKSLLFLFYVLYLLTFSDTSFCKTLGGSFCLFNEDFIRERHNELRLKHNAEPLFWSTQLEKAADDEAKLIKENFNCIVMIKQINTNYFTISPNSKNESAVDSWYEGINNYDFELGPINRDDDRVFEFTNIVWNSAEHIGCSSACCSKTGVLICKYDNYTNRPGMHIKYMSAKKLFIYFFFNK
ncbi:cysteine-rich secretory protein [Plasmodium gonderi]|uniref:Cysteine-rich secretory protein n=1 Tax=Plasmodium gonderi TaxID=77519 RepID=A0A1Y1JCG8_PLAGO|nr:cysteine-rich secretory protein [Plasmodium gonderi]GAW78897.1 cysteine-rich secretory protein [Plasmodium gonderi]